MTVVHFCIYQRHYRCNNVASIAVIEQPRTNEDYSIGIICASPIEKAAVVSIPDEERHTQNRKHHHVMDYTHSWIADHNVVFARPPAGSKGTTFSFSC